MQIKNISIVDQLCVAPIVQQVVGGLIILSNTMKIIKDISILAFWNLAMSYKEKELNIKRPRNLTQSDIQTIKSGGNYSPNLTSYLEYLTACFSANQRASTQPINPQTVRNEIKNQIIQIVSIEYKIMMRKQCLHKHAKYIGIGCIRATPIVGTVYSCYKIKKVLDEKLKISIYDN